MSSTHFGWIKVNDKGFSRFKYVLRDIFQFASGRNYVYCGIVVLIFNCAFKTIQRTLC